MRLKKATLVLAAACSLALIGDGSAGVPSAGGPAQASETAAAVREKRIAFLKKSALPVSSIDPENTDFADLEPLREAIGDRRIVMLGESTHGDGATFAAKVRMIKFLHERMGFDVLAFESGFYDMRRAWSEVRSGRDPQPALASALFVDWSASRQMLPLWRYIAGRLETGRPLEPAGFDIQFTGSASRDHLSDDLRDYLTRAGLPPRAAGPAARVTEALALVTSDPGFIMNGSRFKSVRLEDQAAVLIAHQALGEELGRLRPSDAPGMAERDFWVQFLKSSAAFLEQSWHVHVEALESAVLDWAAGLRDRQMADNLIWMATRAYPTRKIIVWAATSHLIRHRNFFMNMYDPKILMGDWIDRAIGPEVYTIGFTAYRGRWGTVEMAAPEDLVPAEPNSLEELFFSAGFEFALQDLRNPAPGGAWLQEPLSCRPMGSKPMITDWTRIMDGIFFIKEMVPSVRIGPAGLKN